MKLFMKLLALAALAGPAGAAPVHIALKPAASVAADADGFFTLGAVADLSGGPAPLRLRLARVLVGRAPLSGETRRLTRGDLVLKLRQAGCDPDTSAVLEGADAAAVMVAAPTPRPSPASGRGEPEGKEREPSVPTSSSVSLFDSPLPQAGEGRGVGAALPLIHRGDPVTIVIQAGPLTVTAPGTARENGTAGQSIRVHRDGVMTDLTVQVLDPQTVQMEI